MRRSTWCYHLLERFNESNHWILPISSLRTGPEQHGSRFLQSLAYKTRQDETRQDETRRDETERDKTKRDRTRQDKYTFYTYTYTKTHAHTHANTLHVQKKKARTTRSSGFARLHYRIESADDQKEFHRSILQEEHCFLDRRSSPADSSRPHWPEGTCAVYSTCAATVFRRKCHHASVLVSLEMFGVSFVLEASLRRNS